MWVLPKNLHISAYAVDMGALISDLKEQSEMCEQSLLVRSKPMLSRTWLRKWKRDSWTLRLSGRILKHSHGNSFAEKWTSYQGAFLANHLAPAENEKETLTKDTFSPSLKEESNLLDLPLFSSKTYREYLVQNYDQINGQTPLTHPFCYMSLESWSAWDTRQRRAYSQRVKSEHRTNENEFLFLQYQTSLSSLVLNSLQNTSSNQTQTQTQAQLIDTTQKSIEQHTRDTKGLSNTDMKPLAKLADKERWATPTARDWKGKYSRQSQEKKFRNLLTDQAHMGTYKGYLNPRWVEQLMGLPVGWVQVSCLNVTITELTNSDFSGMESCPTQQREPLKPCGLNWPTPTTRDWKDTNSIPPCVGKTRGSTLPNSCAEEYLKQQKI